MKYVTQNVCICIIQVHVQFSRLGTQVAYSFFVHVFVLFGCGVLGLGFLSSLPLHMYIHVLHMYVHVLYMYMHSKDTHTRNKATQTKYQRQQLVFFKKYELPWVRMEPSALYIG